MKHRFYVKSKKDQIKIQCLIGFAALLLVLIAFLVSWQTDIYWFVIITFPIILSIIAPFFDTPSLVRSGKLRYYSPLFLAENAKNGIIHVHGGSLFDYVFVLDKRMTSKQRTQYIMQQFAEGLLNLMEDHQNLKSERITVRGTSYIINERTAKRMGFRVVETDTIQKIILVYNYFSVLLTHSMAKGRLSFPKISKTITFEASLDELIKRNEFVKEVKERLSLPL